MRIEKEKNQELIRRYPALNFHRTMERKSENGESETFFVYKTVWKHVDGENYDIEVILPISFIFDKAKDFEITYLRSKDISLTPRKFEENANIRNTSNAVSSIATPRIDNNSTIEEYERYLDAVNRVKSGQQLDIIFPDLSHYVRNVATPLKGIASSVAYEFHTDRVSKEIVELFYEIGSLNRSNVNKIISEIDKNYKFCNFRLRAILAIILNLLKSIDIDTQDNFSEIREKILRLLREIDTSFIVIIPEEKFIEPINIAKENADNDIVAETIDENTSMERCKEIIAGLLERTLRIGDREIPFYLQLRIRNEIKIGKDIKILIMIIYYLRLIINIRTSNSKTYSETYKFSNTSYSYYLYRNAENELRNIFSFREAAKAREEGQQVYERNRVGERIRGCIRNALLAIALVSSFSCVAFSCFAAGRVIGMSPLFEIIKDIINRLIGILQNLVQEVLRLIEGLNEFTEQTKVRVLELIQEAKVEFKRVIKEGVDNGTINPNDSEIICNQFDLCIDDIVRDVEDGDVDGTVDKLRNLIDSIKQANPPFMIGRDVSPVNSSEGNSGLVGDVPYGVEPVDIPFDPEISFSNPLSPDDSFSKLGVKVSLRSHSVNGEDVIVLVAYDINGNLTNVPSEVGLYSLGSNGELQLETSNSVDINGISYFYTSQSSAASISPYGRHGLVP